MAPLPIPQNHQIFSFSQGLPVMLFNLQTKYYNGNIGELVSEETINGRYELKMKDGSSKSIKPENMKYIPIKIVDLDGEYNGMEGYINSPY